MATRTGSLDVRPLPHGEKHSRVFGKFDGLEPGESFVLVSDHEPRGLLAEFQAKRPHDFEWNVIEKGPEIFRIEIERRTSSDSRNVSEFLGRDHDRLDALLAEARSRAGAGAVSGSRSSFAEFSDGLIRHIQMEENVLFPAFEEATGMRGGPTAVMRSEHREIGRLLEEGKAALAADDARSFLVAADQLSNVLGAHNQKEEGVLYPMMDRSLPDERRRDDLVRSLQSQTAEGGCGCCSHEQASPAPRGRRLGVV